MFLSLYFCYKINQSFLTAGKFIIFFGSHFDSLISINKKRLHYIFMLHGLTIDCCNNKVN